MEHKEVEVSKHKNNRTGKWEIRVSGITSGFVVHTESDNSSIVFQFDASRFNPIVKVI